MTSGDCDVFRQIAELSRGLVEDYRAEKKGKLQRTLYSGSSAANSRVNKVFSLSLVGLSELIICF